MASFPHTLMPSAGFAPQADATIRSVEQDRAILGLLYRKHAPTIYRFLLGIVRDPVLAADATQETFVRASYRLAGFTDRENTAPWLFGIARNVSLELRKARRKTHERYAWRSESEPVGQTQRSPEGELLDREALALVTEALDELSEDRRAALLLRLDHGLSYEEIGRLMGWSLAKVKVEIFRGRERLRQVMEEHEGGAR